MNDDINAIDQKRHEEITTALARIEAELSSAKAIMIQSPGDTYRFHSSPHVRSLLEQREELTQELLLLPPV